MRSQTQTVGEPQPRFTIEFDATSLRAAALVLFSAFWIYTALLTLPFTYWIPGTGLDDSHAFGSNYFPNAGFRYGSDLVFTYGPFGYLNHPEDIGNHILIANLFRAAMWLALLSHLILFYRLGMNGFWKSLLLMLSIAAARNLLLFSFDYYALTVLVVLVLYLIEQPQAWLAPACLVFIVGVLGMVKFASYVLALTCVVLLLAVHSSSRRELVHRKVLYLGVAALAAMPVAFLLQNPSLRAFFNYTYGMLQLSSGYNEAMSLPTGSADIFYMVVLGAMLVFAIIYASAKRALTWKAAPVLLLVYWVNFKHGFVRDGSHAVIAFSFEIVIAAVVICLLRQGSKLIPQYLVAYPFFVIVALSGTNLNWPGVWTEEFWSSAGTRRTTAELINWTATANRINAETNKTDEFQLLPNAFRDRLENSTATVFPWELAYAVSGHFKLQPLYTMQAYNAYTEYLDWKTADHLRVNRDRSEYVLFDWHSIDERHPLLDSPATWMALVDNYEPAEVSVDKFLLKRREIPTNHRQRVLRDLALPLGKWVDLPDAKIELWARIRIPYSAFGVLRKAAYKANAIYLTVQSRDLTARFRVMPGVLSSPFPLNAFPVDFGSFVKLLQSKRVEAPITRIRLDTEFPADYRQPSLELLEETESQLTFIDSSERYVQDRFLASPSPATAGGSLDVVDENEIAGWAWDRAQPNSHVRVEIRDGDTVIDTVGAVLFRRDLLDGGFGRGDYMFKYPLPPQLRDGKPHMIRVMVAGANVELPGSPKKFMAKR